MKGDFTRSTFRPARHYSGVRQQQGRVQLDADWNEQVDIDAHRDTATTADLVRGCGTPWKGDGFKVSVTPGGFDLAIAPGHFYVDGVICEYEATPIDVSSPPSSWTTTSTIKLTKTIEDDVNLEKEQWVEVADAGSPPGSSLFRITEITFGADSRTIKVVGAVPATARTVRRIVTYETQPDYPLPTPKPTLPDGTYLAYLDIWQLHLTAVNRPAIREVALGGPDTATRTKTAWQVKLLPANAAAHCSDLRNWTPQASTGRLRAKAEVPTVPPNECTVPPNAGYVRLENQLYRVEVHTVDASGGVTEYKWSRENGSVVATLVDSSATSRTVTVDQPGKDSVLRFESGRWIEIVEEEKMLRGEPGPLFQVQNVDGTVITVNPLPAPAPPNRADLSNSRVVVVRRWEHYEGSPTYNWTALEDGVSIQFEAGKVYRPGDYWLIPARTFTGNVEWPSDGAGSLYEPPEGIQHRFCPLALIDWNGYSGWTDVRDCRDRFPSVTDLTALLYVSGDGQEVMPDLTPPPPARVLLEKPLIVAVTNGQWPVEGAAVQFKVQTPGAGFVQEHEPSACPASGSSPVVVHTDADGLARCYWCLDATAYSPGGPVREQQVMATLLKDDDITPAPNPPILFNASLSVANEVAYDPRAVCGGHPTMDGNGAVVKTVQQAIDRLTWLSSLSYVSGDAQEVIPDLTSSSLIPAREPLRVLVRNACGVLADAQVTFTIPYGDSNGQLQGTAQSVTVSTESDGIATCTWMLDPRVLVQHVVATLDTLPGDNQIGSPDSYTFTAHLSVAGQVAYDPARCSNLAGVKTVQDAIDQLCRTATTDPGIRVKEVLTINPRGALQNDARLLTTVLANGIRIVCEVPVEDTVGERRPTCSVAVDLPYPLTDADRALWGEPRIGLTAVTLEAQCTVQDNAIIWEPSAAARTWLTTKLFDVLTKRRFEGAVLGRLTLNGNFVWAADRVSTYLDGEVFGFRRIRGVGAVDVRFPSGDGRRGGKLEMWFWLVPAPLLVNLVFTPDIVVGGEPVLGSVSFASPVLEDVPVRLAVAPDTPDNPVRVEAGVLVRQGSASQAFSIRTVPVFAETVVTVAAIAGEVTVTATLTLRPRGGPGVPVVVTENPVGPGTVVPS